MELAHPQAAVDRGVRTYARHAAALAEREFLPAFLVVLLATALLVRLPRLLAPDTWLALVAAREIRTVGLPARDTLTAWTLGEPWVDQQWLAQLAIYAVHAVGGMRLALALNALAVVLAFAAALALARARGGSPTSTAVVGLMCLIVAAPSTALRTETLAHVLFAAVLWLLLVRGPPSVFRVFVLAAVLIVWANVHGSVVIGAGLAAGLGIAETLRRGVPRRRRLTGLGLAATPALVFASPYASSLPAYYRATAGNSLFPELLTEWRPTALPQDWRFFLLAFAGTALVARYGGRLTRFEFGAFVGLLVLGLVANRYTVWFALLCAALLPRLADEIRPLQHVPATRRPRLIAGSAAVAALVVVAGWSLSRPQEWYEQQYPARALASVRSSLASKPDRLVLASERYADWILWKLPAARGTVLYDARFELLGDDRLRDLIRLANASQGWRSVIEPADVLVLEHEKHAAIIRILVENGARPIEASEIVVLERVSGDA